MILQANQHPSLPPSTQDDIAHESIPHCGVCPTHPELHTDPSLFRNPLMRGRLDTASRTLNLYSTGTVETFEEMIRRRDNFQTRSWTLQSFVSELTSERGMEILNAGVSCYTVLKLPNGEFYLLLPQRKKDDAYILPQGHYDLSHYSRDITGTQQAEWYIAAALEELLQEVVPLTASGHVVSPALSLPRTSPLQSLFPNLKRDESGSWVFLPHPYPALSEPELFQTERLKILPGNFQPPLPNILEGYRIFIDGEELPLMRASLFAYWNSIQLHLPVILEVPPKVVRFIHGEDRLAILDGKPTLITELFTNNIRLFRLLESCPASRPDFSRTFLPLFSAAHGRPVPSNSPQPLLSESFFPDNLPLRIQGIPGVVGSPNGRDVATLGIGTDPHSYQTNMSSRERYQAMGRHFPHF